MTNATLILAPLRGVTIRCFRETFASEIAAAGFVEAFTPFVSAMPGVDPMKDRELKASAPTAGSASLKLTPQFIGKDPQSLRQSLVRIKAAGFDTADLNCGCPFPMVRNKGRGSGLLRTPDRLQQMLEVGCEVMGPGKFSLKARLGVDRNDELLKLMPMINLFPLRFLTVHARTARQMYSGECDWAAYDRIAATAKIPLVRNGDLDIANIADGRVMIGRSFIRSLGDRGDSVDLLRRYLEASRVELCGDRPVLGRLKELVAYWQDLPRWHRCWQMMKLACTLDEFLTVLKGQQHD